MDYLDFTIALSNLNKDYKSDQEYLVGHYQNYFPQLHERFRSSIVNTDIFNVPEDPGDAGAMLQWIRRQTKALAFLNDEKFFMSFANKGQDTSVFRELNQAREDTREIRGLIDEWIDLYKNNFQILLKKDGSYRSLEEVKEGSPEAQAIQKRLDLEQKFRNFSLVKNEFIENSKLNVMSLKEHTQFINNLRDPNFDKKSIDPFFALSVLSHAIEKYSNKPELICGCGEAVDNLVKLYADNEEFTKHINTSEVQDTIRYIKRQSDAAASVVYENANTKIVKENSRSTRSALKNFATELKGASIHDSKEYKELINMVEAFSKEDSYCTLNKNGGAVGEFSKWDANTREAYPLFMIHNRINKYLEHKAKDGINRNSFNKLEVIERLNQYVCGKLQELDPKEFTFTEKDAKDQVKEVHSFSKGIANKTYAEELAYQRKKIDNFKVDNGPDAEKGIALIMKESKLKMTEGFKQPTSVDLIQNTGISEDILQVQTGLNKNSAELKKYKNISDCMDRIMLKAQVEPKNMLKNLKTLCDGGIPKNIPDKLSEARMSFAKELAKIKKQPAKDAPQGPNM